MNLDEYFVALKNTRDEKVPVRLESETRQLSRLTAELGAYDNYSIALKGNAKLIVEFLGKKNYKIGCESADYSYVNHPQGLGWVEITKGLGKVNFGYLDLKTEGEEIVRRIERDFDLSIMFHDYDHALTKSVSPIQGVALMIVDVIECIQQHKLPACFPNSMGWNNLEDLSRIIWYEPKVS